MEIFNFGFMTNDDSRRSSCQGHLPQRTRSPFDAQIDALLTKLQPYRFKHNTETFIANEGMYTGQVSWDNIKGTVARHQS